MNKPQSLRHALNKAVPYVRNNPDKLHLFVDNGSLVATGASSMSWEYRYTLNVVIEDFSGDQNLLMAPVLLWLRDNQPMPSITRRYGKSYSPLMWIFCATMSVISALICN